MGRGKAKRFCIQPVAGRYTQLYPKLLAHGEQASFLVSFLASPDWAKKFATGFVEDLSEKNLKTLRAMVHISVGKSIEVVPEENLIERIRAHAC